MTTVTIASGSPCEGRLDSLLELACTGRDGSTDIREHMASCHRCSSFVENIEAERRVTEMVNYDVRGTRTVSPVPESLDELSSWIRDHARWQVERELAAAYVALAKSLFHQGPSREALVLNEPESIRGSQQRVAKLLPELERLLRGSPKNKFKVESSEKLAALASNVESAISKTSDRFRVIQKLCKRAHELCNGQCAGAFLREAFVDWWHGSGDEVPNLLARTEESGTTGRERGHALGTLAVWLAEHESFESAIHTNKSALALIDARDGIVIPAWFNGAMWTWLMGRSRQALRELKAIGEGFPTFEIRKRLPCEALCRAAARLGVIHGVSSERVKEFQCAMSRVVWGASAEGC